MNLTKDTYEYLTNFANDRDILNMLSVNRKFSDDAFFYRVMKRRYPLLLKYKKKDETYKRLYLRMITYISKLNDEFGIPYMPHPIFNPDRFYNQNKYNKLIYTRAA